MKPRIVVMGLRVWTIGLILCLCLQTVGSAGGNAGLAEEADRNFQQGVVQFQQEQLDSAIAAWERALLQYQKLQDRDAIQTTQRNLGAVWQRIFNQAYRQGQYRKALAAGRAAISMVQGDRRLVAILQGRLATIEKQLGNYGEAKKLNQLALDYFETSPSSIEQAQISGNQGNVYEALGDYEQALRYHEQSLKFAQTAKSRLAQSIATGNLGGVYASLGQYKRAIPLLQQSLEISQEIANQSAQASALINLGSAHHALKELEQADKYYQQALKIAQEIQDKVRESQAVGSLGLVASDQRNFAQAIQLQQKSLAIAQELGDVQLQGVALNNLGHALLSAKKLDEAQKILRQALKLLDGLRPSLSDIYKVSIFDTQIQTYNLLQQVLVAANQPEQALEVSEQSRARAFAELLAQRLVAPGQRKQTEIKPITLAEIRRIAKAQNATLVEYSIVIDDDFKFRGKQRSREEELLIWVVQPSGEVALRRVPMKSRFKTEKGSLNRLIGAARCLSPAPVCPSLVDAFGGMVGTATIPVGATESLTYPGLPELHQVLIEPIQDLLPKDSQSSVVIIPQSGLFLVPFAALPDATGKYLIEKYALRMVPSIQVLGLTQQQAGRVTGKGAIVVGNPEPMPEGLAPLPGSEQEAKTVAALLKVPAILGQQATRKTILPTLEKARVIHLATHGLLEYGQVSGLDTPGAIALSTMNQDNGLLTSPEILNLNLQADLVVLSACDTGRGTITGDGVLGLSRAWIGAGVPSVVVSLWAVNDESTAALMVEFYRSMQDNNRSTALRSAMLKTMQKYPSPKDWAAFTLMGQ